LILLKNKGSPEFPKTVALASDEAFENILKHHKQPLGAGAEAWSTDH
jgi:hypothetical protein